jgi:dienelactone hydrolase
MISPRTRAFFALAVIASAPACSSDPRSTTTPPPVPVPSGDTTFIPATGSASQTPTRKTATTHPMQYYISVPRGWSGARGWPVVVVSEGAGKDWQGNATQFATARDQQDYPFIIITPVFTTNGEHSGRLNPKYQYSSSTWDLVEQQGACPFDLNGVHAVLDDVRRLYGGQGKPFLTGFSGGGAYTWASIFLEPERLRAAAQSSTNYYGRCLTVDVPTPRPVSTAPERVTLPIRAFRGADEPSPSVLTEQVAEAMRIASVNGYTNLSNVVVPGFGHDRMPGPILSYFFSLLPASER